MKNKIYILLLLVFISCKNNSYEETTSENENSTEFSTDENDEQINEDDETVIDEENLIAEPKFEDGTYNASVDYYNPKTGYSANYDLEVEVEDNEVVRINFPKGGWLDDDIHPSESRLSPSELDENGETTMEDDNGRTFEVKIEK